MAADLRMDFPSKEALYLEIQNFTCKTTDPAVERLTTLPPTTSRNVADESATQTLPVQLQPVSPLRKPIRDVSVMISPTAVTLDRK